MAKPFEVKFTIFAEARDEQVVKDVTTLLEIMLNYMMDNAVVTSEDMPLISEEVEWDRE